MLPAEQIEYGWINANAMTIVDLQRRKRHATVLLDQPDQGAADPWGTAISKDGATLWIALSGVHQLGRLDLARLHRLLDQELPALAKQQSQKAGASGAAGVTRGSMDYSDPQPAAGDRTSVELVTGDLPVEYGRGRYLRGVWQRVDLPGKGPRGLAILPDGTQLAAATYFSGTVALIDPRTTKVARRVSLPGQSPAGLARQGEAIFHDATRCFQHWLSCATCHPDGRADGLNWDLMNDGIGNPKNTRSLLWSHRTSPVMARGVRSTMEEATAAGFKWILFREAKSDDLRAVEAYLRALGPTPSPYLVAGRLSEKAQRGKAVFESPQTRCAACHAPPLYTDQRMHDVGTRAAGDEAADFNTPKLVELWRTAPYLHHGQASTLKEVLTRLNLHDRHGKTSNLRDDEVEALIEFLKSL
jgi:cytochrome c peroxidase